MIHAVDTHILNLDMEAQILKLALHSETQVSTSTGQLVGHHASILTEFHASQGDLQHVSKARECTL